ncbi:DNA polymerase III delta prime subunit [Carbonactinospora thermoautotrophica]|uniref:DNA polymerase III delta prime subunit n=1 Tax=Carbonactinospora thermoautotrophica TaxID=1469144 RepID=A0A132MLZ0_9ACTN|nr:DNA polymerase III subunit delta' [Carbonactinospora thermoautotrophica]KWW98848.1 DNA polymerase III delta prime subunit [Carbonactinospora thermoautotrophica]
MSVWDDLVGQEHVVAQLKSTVDAAAAVLRGEPATGMTHAWLFTGPPGSGRSTAARAFAAALQCPSGGCGACEACHTVLAGTHADVHLISTELLSIGVKDTRDLVRRAALSPAGNRWQIIVMEDADRLTESAGNVLLKAIEEPAPRTVWMLCSPALEDVLPTIRSRCRHVLLRTPPVEAVAQVLVRRDGVDPAMAGFAARAAQGHIGRAKRLATDEQARQRRAAVLNLPSQLSDVASCLAAAQHLVAAAEEEAKESTEELNARETEELKTALGVGQGGRTPPGAASALKELENRQKKRATRLQRDALDRALVDLASLYRDVLAVQLGASVPLTNEEQRPFVMKLARDSTPEATVRRIQAILACRKAIEANVAPLLAVEAMTLSLRAG